LLSTFQLLDQLSGSREPLEYRVYAGRAILVESEVG
jgi:hypothetical protein